MKEPSEIKPEFESKLRISGDSCVVTVPKLLIELFELKEGCTYKLQILKELEKCRLRITDTQSWFVVDIWTPTTYK